MSITTRPIYELGDLAKQDLIVRFQALYGCLPPKHLRRALLLQAVAHRLQERAQGGPEPALRRRLARMAEVLHRTGTIAVKRRPLLKPGTRLLRDWQGETHSVTVTEDGFEYRGTRYRSLSQIARAITGTRWSGPAFFGLNGRGTG